MKYFQRLIFALAITAVVEALIYIAGIFVKVPYIDPYSVKFIAATVVVSFIIAPLVSSMIKFSD